MGEAATTRVHPALGSDEELVGRFHAGDPQAVEDLLSRYREFARMKARSYFLAGGDHDDVVQEAMVGLYKAIRDYDAAREIPFRSFAEVCVTRQLVTAVKSATRHKHSPLNSSVSLSTPLGGAEDEGERTLADVMAAPADADPAELLVSREELDGFRASFGRALSGFEIEVLRLYVEGKSYQEMSRHLRRGVKSVDNALQRIKRKLERELREPEPEAEPATLARPA